MAKKASGNKEHRILNRISAFAHTGRGSRLIVLLLLVLLILTGITAKYALLEWRGDHVTKLAITQDESTLNIRWNKIRSKEYKIDVYTGGKRILSQYVKTNSYRVDGIDFLQDYKITIYGKSDEGKYAQGASETIFTRNPQKIETEIKKAEGFAGDSVELGAKAEVPLTYKSANESIAKVDENGKITFSKNGITQIIVKAPANEDNLSDSISITAVCYPRSLTKPSLSLKKGEGASAVFKIGKVSYAETYELLRLDPETEEYESIAVIKEKDFGKKKSLEFETARDIGDYSLRAVAKVGDHRIESDRSRTVSVKSGLDGAATYSSITTILEIGSDDVDRVVSASGSGSAGVAQSMCCTGDGYVVAFVNRGNSTGCLKKYDMKGKEIAANTNTGNIGHANGCTYDPKTGCVYVMKTYASAKYHDIRVFDGETLESRDSISFGTAPSGIGYDATTKQFYMTASSRVYVTDSNLSMVRTIHRKRAYRSQDVAGYNGIVMSCIWTGGSGSYIDMYRALNGAYLGSIYAPFGEIESACVEDGHLVMLYNGGSVYRTKERIDFPG